VALSAHVTLAVFVPTRLIEPHGGSAQRGLPSTVDGRRANAGVLGAEADAAQETGERLRRRAAADQAQRGRDPRKVPLARRQQHANLDDHGRPRRGRALQAVMRGFADVQKA